MKNLFKLYLLSFILLSDFMVFAQPAADDGSGGVEGGDPPVAPINSKLIFLALIGLIFVFYSLKKRTKLN